MARLTPPVVSSLVGLSDTAIDAAVQPQGIALVNGKWRPVNISILAPSPPASAAAILSSYTASASLVGTVTSTLSVAALAAPGDLIVALPVAATWSAYPGLPVISDPDTTLALTEVDTPLAGPAGESVSRCFWKIAEEGDANEPISFTFSGGSGSSMRRNYGLYVIPGPFGAGLLGSTRTASRAFVVPQDVGAAAVSAAGATDLLLFGLVVDSSDVTPVVTDPVGSLAKVATSMRHANGLAILAKQGAPDAWVLNSPTGGAGVWHAVRLRVA